MFEFMAAKAGEFGANGIELKGSLDDGENRPVVPVEKLISGQHSRADVHEKELENFGGDVGAEAGLEDGEAVDGEDSDEGSRGLAGFFKGPFDSEAGEQFEGILDGFQLYRVGGCKGVGGGKGVGFGFGVVAEGGEAVRELSFKGGEVGVGGGVFELFGEDSEAVGREVAREGDGGDGIGKQSYHLLPVLLLGPNAAPSVSRVVLNDLNEGAGGDEDIVGVGIGPECFRKTVDLCFEPVTRVDVGFDHVDAERGQDHLQRAAKGVGLPGSTGMIERFFE